MKLTRSSNHVFGLLLILILGFAHVSQASASLIYVPTANNVDTSPGAPTVLNFNVTETGIISDLNVRLHFDNTGDGGSTYWDNMFVQISHEGIDVILMDLQTDNAGSDSTLVATFADGGSDLASSMVINGLTIGEFSPQEPLSAFDGEALEGEWTLTLYDNAGYANDGTDLVEWGFANPVPALSDFGLALAVLALLLLAFRHFNNTARREVV